MRKIYSVLILIVLLCAISISREQNNKVVQSPDKKVKIIFSVFNGQPSYSVFYKNKIVIVRSGLGFILKGENPLLENIKITDIKDNSFDETWKPVWGFSSEIRNNYNESTISLADHNGVKCDLIFRAYNDGIAFRYLLPEQSSYREADIIDEKTEFNFKKDHDVWWIPAEIFAYEGVFQKSPISKIEHVNTPLTIETKDGLFLSIHEAALIDYSEMTLKRNSKPFSLISSLAPGKDDIKVKRVLPFRTPWRTIQISEKPSGLIESHLIQNLNEPCALKETSWIKPMKFIGIWWGMHIKDYTWYAGPKHGATTENMKCYIDFAAKHKIGGVLAEGWNLGWETWTGDQICKMDYTKPYPDFDIDEVVRYAKEKGVEFISHHETGGNIPEYERQLDSAFSLCSRLGIGSVKTGYAGQILPKGFHHHGQMMVNHFMKVVETAAKYKITLNAHEAIKPTGLDRTYPNLMSQEAVRGIEWCSGSGFNVPMHTATLPFTRMLAGPFDYTPGIFNIIHHPKENYRLYSTLANQLALFVVLYSPLMMAADKIENYENNPAFKFIEDVPCTWDETKVLNGVIGDFVTIARRSGSEWYIGAVTDENSRLLKTSLNFLEKNKKYIAEIYSDDIKTDLIDNPTAVQIEKFIVKSSDFLNYALAKGGGIAMRIYPAGNENIADLKSVSVFNKTAGEKARIFLSGNGLSGKPVSNKAIGKKIKIKNKYNDNYSAGGDNGLIDGVRGMKNYACGLWQGYEYEDMEVIIDLGKTDDIKKISAGFLESLNQWIFLPSEIEYSISNDGKEYIKIADFPIPDSIQTDLLETEIKEFSKEFRNVKARYIKVAAKNRKTCPKWHPAKGGKAWIFCDEIIVE